MHVHFDPDFDGGAVVGAEGTAHFGRAVVGPRGFLNILETSLGLGGVYPSDIERVVALLPHVKQTPGFWTQSAQYDPIGATERLLRWRDTLIAWGWTGKARAGRLGPLWDLMQAAPPGLVDRTRAVAQRLQTRNARIDALTLYAPADAAGPMYERVANALAAQGTEVVQAPTPDASTFSTKTNLGRLQRALMDEAPFRIERNDVSLQLLRPYGWGQAADAVAALLAPNYASESRKTTRPALAIIGADVALDDALFRHGVPTTGRSRSERGVQASNAVLHALPLACELATTNADPQRALDLLTLPDSPIPFMFRRPLAKLMGDAPSTTSEAFRNKQAALLAKTEDAKKRAKRSALLDAFLRPPLTPGGAKTAHLHSLIDYTEAWANEAIAYTHAGTAEGEYASEADTAEWYAVLQQCGTLRRIVTGLGADVMSKPRLRQALAASMPTSSRSSYRAQAGTVPLASPGGLAAPANAVLWWNFVRKGSSRHGDLPLHKDERMSLVEHGVPAYDAARYAQLEKARERRAFLNATDRLLLVCPERGNDGEAQHPHALWDEVRARVDPEGAPLAALEHALPQSDSPRPTQVRPHRALIKPERTLSLAPGTVPERDGESPSSIATYLGCDLKHLLQYGAKIYPGAHAHVELSARTLGTAAHAVLEELGKNGAFGRNAGVEAAEYFDAHIDEHIAQLGDPAREGERTSLRDTVVNTAESLGRLVQDEGFSVYKVEERTAGVLDSIAIAGRPDIVLRDKNGRLVVVDFKFGSGNKRAADLKDGTALQLAAYAKLLEKESQGPVSIAYFILREGRLMLSDDGLTDEGTTIDGPDVDTVWSSVAHAFTARREARKAGAIEARGLGGKDAVASRHHLLPIEEGGFSAQAPCGFCDYKKLCGLVFEDDASAAKAAP